MLFSTAKMTSPLPGYKYHFGVRNIPFGIASSQQHPHPTCVSRYEDQVLFLSELDHLFHDIDGLPGDALRSKFLNKFASLSRETQANVRQRLQNAIQEDPTLANFPTEAVEPIELVSMHLPVAVGDFTDFSCSLHHVQNAAAAMTGKLSAPPAFFDMPIGYAGRCSSLDVSGTPVERPMGQYWEGRPGESRVVFGPSRKMDYELELGAIVGKPVARRQRLLASQADEHIFGYVLLNDWSARDIQQLEMTPLGPLNGKNSATTISPWVITADALAHFKTKSPVRTQLVKPYLADSGQEALDIKLQVHVSARESNAESSELHCISNTSMMYWTLGQCLAHQAIGGPGLNTGDLLGSGTVSGEGRNEHGCLMEHMRIGENPTRRYLEDGETVVLSGFCGNGVGFGECVATLQPTRYFDPCE